MPINVKLPNGQVKSYPDDTPVEVIQADIQKEMTGLRMLQPPPATGADPFEGVSGPDLLKGMGSTALQALELGSGIFPQGRMTRTAVNLGRGALGTAFGAARGQLEEGDPLPNMGFQAALGSLPLVGQGAERLGQHLALSLGGMFKGQNPVVAAIIRNAERLRKPGRGRALPVGALERGKDLIKEGGQRVQQIEEAVPGRPVDIFGAIQGSTSPAQARAATGSLPISTPGRIAKSEEDVLAEILAANANVDVADARAFIRAGGNIDIPFTARESGDVMRDLGQRARGFFDKSGEGRLMSSTELLDPKAAAGMRESVKSARRRIPEFGQQLDESESALADLFTQQGASQNLRAGGRVMADPAAFGVRAGFGAPTGFALGSLFGLDPATSATVGGLGSLFMLSPRGMSSTSLALGRLLGLAPTAARTTEAALDVSEGLNRPRVRRRRPR